MMQNEKFLKELENVITVSQFQAECQSLLGTAQKSDLRPIKSGEFANLRTSLALTKKEFAALLGLTARTLSEYEKLAVEKPEEILPIREHQLEICFRLQARIKAEKEYSRSFGARLKERLAAGGFIASILLILGITK